MYFIYIALLVLPNAITVEDDTFTPAYDCEDCCGGVWRHHCHKNEFSHPACPVIPAGHCCVPLAFDCHDCCGGVCRKDECSSSEIQALECIGCKKGFVCCVPIPPHCEDKCGGTCRAHKCNRNEIEEPGCTGCTRGRVCCVTSSIWSTLQIDV
ncbi:uncharacterized protein LOC144354643 isoform X1 [Saccoglossus kowalevskii]